METGTANSPWPLLRSGPFRYLWLGQVVSQIGDGLNKIALLWFVYQLTGSALDMTLVGVLQSIPPLVMSPLTGVYIDRVSKRRLLVSLDLMRVATVVLIPLLYYFGLLTLPGIYVLVLANAVVSAAFGPAMAAVIPQLVKPSQLTGANGLIHGAATTGVLVGPAIGGALATFIGAQNVLYIDAATFLFSAACMSLLNVPPLARAQRQNGATTVTAELRESMRFVLRGEPAISTFLITSAAFAGAMGAFPLLLPVFAKVSLHVGSAWLGWLWSSLGAGMVLVTTALAWTKHRSEAVRLAIMAAGIGCASISMLGLTWTPGPWGALCLIALIGAGTAIFTPLLWSLLQERTPQSLRGRVFTLTGASDMASSTMAMACMGWVAGALGPDTSLRADSAILFIVAVLLARLCRSRLQGESRPARTGVGASPRSAAHVRDVHAH